MIGTYLQIESDGDGGEQHGREGARLARAGRTGSCTPEKEKMAPS
jgi:hypothetical protein